MTVSTQFDIGRCWYHAATLGVRLVSGWCQVGCQAAVRCCHIVKSAVRHCQTLSALAAKAVKPGLK
eukprot:3563524-Prymnesium_polylepis.1